MAGSITVSSITLDSDNNFSIRSNTGTTILSANGTGLITGIANGASIVSAQLTTPTVSGNLSLDSTGTTGIRLPSANTLTFHTAGAEDMRIDSSGQVGIGTSSPSNPLDVVANSGASAMTIRGRSADNISTLRFTSNNAASTYSQIQSRSNGFWINAVANIPMQFFTNDTERMSIDTSGRVTKPYQPMFNVRNDTGQNITTSTGNQVITFTSVNNNVGSHYNTSNSRFTAPVAGSYFFAFNATFDVPGSVRVCEFALRVNNGSDYAVASFAIPDFSGGTNEHPGISISAVIYLNAGDYLTVSQRTHLDISGTVNLRGGANGFSGYLLG
jgi:hypothetical protein